MKLSHLLLFAAGVPVLAFAQPRQTMPAAADANAPATPLQYQSVFADAVASKDIPSSPDKGWIRANHVLVGDEAAAPVTVEQTTADAFRKASTAEPTHGEHEHKGTHQ